MRVALLVLMLAAAACGGEHSSSTPSDAASAVKETLAAVRAKQRLRIRVRLDRSELPNAEELKTRESIEEQLDLQRVGTVLRRGEGVGWFDIELEVDSTADAVPRVRSILRELGLLEKSSVEIRQGG